MSEQLQQVIQAAQRQNPSIELSGILGKISKETDIPVSDLSRIFRTLENLHNLSEDLGDFDALMTSIIQSVKTDVAEKIKSSVDVIRSALNLYNKDNPVSITLKAQRLTYSRERLFYNAEIITDARPIFDSSGEKVIEFVVTHCLVITSVVDGRRQERYYSIDHADLLILRKACDQALVKSRTLKLAMEDKWPTEILKSNET